MVVKRYWNVYVINGTCGDSAIGHLCELEGNRLHPSTKNHLGTTWFKLIAKMAGKSKLVFFYF